MWSNCNIVVWSNCNIVVWSNYNIMVLSICNIGVLSICNIDVWSNYNAMVWSNCNIVVWSNCNIAVWSNCNIVVWSNCNIVVWSNCNIVGWSNCTIVLWLVGLYYCGVVDLFLLRASETWARESGCCKDSSPRETNPALLTPPRLPAFWLMEDRVELSRARNLKRMTCLNRTYYRYQKQFGDPWHFIEATNPNN